MSLADTAVLPLSENQTGSPVDFTGSPVKEEEEEKEVTTNIMLDPGLKNDCWWRERESQGR